MVPGIAADHRHWNKAIPFFGDGFRIITVDNRGSGVTEYEGGFSMDDMADDIIGLLDYLGIDRADLLGWSMGSHICLDAAARHPERVRSLCLV